MSDQALLSGLDARIASKLVGDLEIAKILSGEWDELASYCGQRSNVPSDEERLAYYRSHGLDRCDDYPGGDAQFEADVLSGLYHNSPDDWEDDPKKEDAYVIARLEDGRFQVDLGFIRHSNCFKLDKAYEAALVQLGWTIT